MSAGLAKAAQIIGVAVSIAAAIPSGGTSLLAAGLSVSATTASLIAVGAGIAAAGITALSAKSPPKNTASPMVWQSNPEDGIPYVMGALFGAGHVAFKYLKAP